jgi:nicotinate-nucleotide--dimethylbenzimidazole phosphoribosyltransferase
MIQLPKIEPVDSSFMKAALARLDSLIKPVGSLGRLEQIASQICAIRRTLTPEVERKKIILFASDHGVVEEGVSAYPQEVTQQMVRGFVMGSAAICVLARNCGIEMQIVDAGMRREMSLPGLIRLHIRNGSRNLLCESAMTSAEVEQAIGAGVQLAKDSARAGVHLIGGGEMGIGNTTSAAAIFAALLDLPPRDVTGYGTGINEQTRAKKIEVIESTHGVGWVRNRMPDRTLFRRGIGAPAGCNRWIHLYCGGRSGNGSDSCCS